MDLKSSLRKYLPLVSFIIILGLVLGLWILYLPTIPVREPYPGQRKAIIVCGANDFYGSEFEDEFNGSPDANFVINTGNWTFIDREMNSFHEWSSFGNETLGSLYIKPTGPAGLINASLTYNWTYPLYEYALYNVSVSIQINETGNFVGNGARIGIQWLNSNDIIVRTDWSTYLSTTGNKWRRINMGGVCNNETANEIFKMKLILAFEGEFMAAGPTDSVHYDDVIVDRLIQVNLTDPTDPDPPQPGKDSDGFPAQALQVYWILKGHGYTDKNIFLMLYHTGDDVIDIDASDIYTNDLNRSGVLADIDVENDDVNASRFKEELDVSIAGSFASGVHSKDQLIIFMTDHGSNAVLPDKNATFHFEADNSYVNETEFYDLVKLINCERMLICVDCCFSGNFLNDNKNIGQSWYNLPNCILISAASNVLSWYWINNKNPDGWAGSWFFHPFWEQLNQNNTIGNAFLFAQNFVPKSNFPRSVALIQNPLIKDYLGVSNTWSFDGIPQL